MGVFDPYIQKIENLDHQARFTSVLEHVKTTFPNLVEEIKWNQPMFTDHGTFIVSFTVSKNHITLAPEFKTLELFDAEIKAAGYARTKMLIQLPWSKPINFDLIDRIIAFNIEDKKEMKNFWREATR